MSNKGEKKKNAVKKTSKIRKTLMLKLDNGVEIPAKTVYMKDNTKCFNGIDINKIRVSEKNRYSKEHNSYKYYELHDDDYIPLRIILKDVVGKCNVYRDKDNNKGGKGMGFKPDDDDLLTKVCNIFEHIEEKLNIALSSFKYESKDEQYLKTKVNDETCFREGKDISTPGEDIKYTCRVLLQIESIFYNMKENNAAIRYFPQVLLEQRV